jgi:DNA-binding IclR family transcriptional regulator
VTQTGGTSNPKATASSAPTDARQPRLRPAIARSRVRVLERAFALLDRFEDGEPHGVTELSHETGIHPATVHRMLATLAERAYLRQEPSDSRYVLGLRLVQLGTAAARSMDVLWAAKPELEKLVDICGETAHLLVQVGTEGLYLDKVESSRHFRMPSQVGRRIALHATAVGKAILAFLPGSEVDRIARETGLPRYTDRTISNLIELRRELESIRQRGYSIDDEEIEVGLRCIGAPTFDAMGQVVAAISLAGPAARLAPGRDDEHGRLVRQAALEISERLGYRLEMHAAERPVPDSAPLAADAADAADAAEAS